MNRIIKVSAPGKLMLLGEHSVVYDHPCIVTAVDQRMSLTAEEADNFQLDASEVKIAGYSKKLEDVGLGDVPKGAQFVEIAFKNLRQRYPGTRGVKIKTSSEFSSSFGFGSSSASTVCTVKALSELFGVKLSLRELFDISYKTVIDIQGKGSGFDVAAAIYGGTLYFWTGGKTITPLKIKELPLIIGYTGVKADTVSLINKVLSLAEKNPGKVNRIYEQIDGLVGKAREAILKSDWKNLGELMNTNQKYLDELGVGSEKLTLMVAASRAVGAYGAKMSGAGGGDCMIAIAPEAKKNAVKQALASVGGEAIDIISNMEGVKVE